MTSNGSKQTKSPPAPRREVANEIETEVLELLQWATFTCDQSIVSLAANNAKNSDIMGEFPKTPSNASRFLSKHLNTPDGMKYILVRSYTSRSEETEHIASNSKRNMMLSIVPHGEAPAISTSARYVSVGGRHDQKMYLGQY